MSRLVFPACQSQALPWIHPVHLDDTCSMGLHGQAPGWVSALDFLLVCSSTDEYVRA